ncbi:MAG: respiratory nitrate reductase subunit gamma [Chitinophagaceae bacterium]|nr:respiratory nitrate reductase subunit gamma [Chitinophagaceae bacterium]
MLNQLLFLVLPYATLLIFLVGTIYRYLYKGFQVSSLSSQFLEGRKLFFASQPFHWGIMFLFFGHLIAFLFPSSLLIWNGHPARLLVMECASFAFGLMALWGLCAFVYRRIANPRIRVVTSKMDIVVYLILFSQIISGLMVAYYNRWGMNWFASFLTPYLRSIILFQPEIEGISTINSFWVKMHLVSAFTLIALIPFTRFMHFMVYPLDYLWRSYQQVVWNIDYKNYRQSKNHSMGHNSRNN